MAGIKELKKRITSVKNTQQTTRAMKLVSAAKVRRSQDAILTKRPYAKSIAHLIRLVSGMSDSHIESRLLGTMSGSLTKSAQKGKCLLVVITSDRGLCGAFNMNIVKTAIPWIQQNAPLFDAMEYCFVGRRGNDFMARRGFKAEKFFEFGRGVTFEQAKDLSEWILAEFESGRVDHVKFVYNEFKNAISQIPTVEDFLPVHGDLKELMKSPAKAGVADDFYPDRDLFLIKPDLKSVLEQLMRRHFALQVFRVLLESQASEHGARMSAMDNATRNAGEMLKKLTLQFNKSRQGAITKELLEIISGSESQKAT